jgi:hypothetical protein
MSYLLNRAGDQVEMLDPNIVCNIDPLRTRSEAGRKRAGLISLPSHFAGR